MRPRAAAALALAAGLALAAQADARTRASLGPEPVHPGERLLVQGTGWRAGEVVSLLVGPPESEADLARRVRAGRDGAFSVRVPVARRAQRGRYVMLVCQRACRIKVTLPFRIT